MTKIGILGLSDPVTSSLQGLLTTLQGYDVTVDSALYKARNPQERSVTWNNWMKDGSYDYIFDVSGGDLSIETIEYLDFSLYRHNKTLFFGYSDLTPILNILAGEKKTGLFQIRGNTNIEDIHRFLEGKDSSLFFEGEYIGGNIRCLLKLAGTSYFPDVSGKHLFLESYSGKENRIRSYFGQLELMGVFDKVTDVTIGQFTELDQTSSNFLETWSKSQSFPVYRNKEVGHSKDSKGIWICDTL